MKIIPANCFCCKQKLDINIETVKYMFEIDIDTISVKCRYCHRVNYIEISAVTFEQIKDRNINATKTLFLKEETSLFD